MANILVVDLEATCGGSIARDEMEIIEIGGVKLDLETFEILDRYESLIKPVRHRELTDFCTELTGITQEMVDDAPSVYEIFEEFGDWVKRGKASLVWGSWGAYDRNQFKQDGMHFGIGSPVPRAHVNLKKLFGEAALRKPCGLAQAVRHCGLKKVGNHHRALDDVINIVRVIQSHPGFGEMIRGERVVREAIGRR